MQSSTMLSLASGLCTQGPSANLLFEECLFCFVFRVGVFCLLTQLKTLKTVPVQWVYKILEIGYSSLTIKDAAKCQIAT